MSEFGKRMVVILSAVLGSALTGVSGAADQQAAGTPPAAPAAAAQADPGHVMMDHSVGDPKSMNMMKDKKVPIHHAGESQKPAAESAPK